jgi:predicted amidohydrolase YtcJ
MAGMGTEYFWQNGVMPYNFDGGPPKMCTKLAAPEETSKMEWCRFAPGSPFAKGVLAVILAKQRLNGGHLYGDKSMDYLLDTIDEAMKLDPTITLDYIRSRRFTADHCGFQPRPDQIQRIARFGMYLGCKGNVLTRTYPSLKVYGMEHANWISPIKSLLKAGAHAALEVPSGRGSSMSSMTSRIPTIFNDGYDLITRKNMQGALVAPEEAIDRMTLMKMATSWGGEYIIREKDLGTLEVGKFADLLVLNKDYFTIPQEQIPEVYPVMTIIGGTIKVIRKEFAQELGRNALGAQLEFIHGQAVWDAREED